MSNMDCWLIRTGLAALAAMPALPLAAQDYPVKVVRMVVPFPAGGSTDVLARMVAPALTETFRQPFVIDNRPGAGGVLAAVMCTRAAPDGYTLGCGQGGNMVIVPLAYKKVAYDSLKDFAPIALMASNFLALAVHPNVPFKTARELIIYGKANPGKLNFGTNGEGAFLHFATELFRKEAGFTYYHVPFKNAGLIVTDLIGGRIDATLSAFITVQPHAVSGRLRILGVARETRAPNYPQWPTLAETVAGFQSGGWFGAVAPAGMAKEQIAYLNREMNTAMRTPDIREKAAILGLDLHTESPEYFTEAIRRDFEKWGKLARDIGFKPQ